MWFSGGGGCYNSSTVSIALIKPLDLLDLLAMAAIWRSGGWVYSSRVDMWISSQFLSKLGDQEKSSWCKALMENNHCYPVILKALALHSRGKYIIPGLRSRPPLLVRCVPRLASARTITNKQNGNETLRPPQLLIKRIHRRARSSILQPSESTMHFWRWFSFFPWWYIL